MRSSTKTIIEALRILANEIQSEDGVVNATIAEAANRLDEMHISESMKEYLDSERATQDALLKRLEETQERMITAERICNKIYIARNITLSEKSILSALAEIDKTYRIKNEGN
jgi:predicted transcriptional regulator